MNKKSVLMEFYNTYNLYNIELLESENLSSFEEFMNDFGIKVNKDFVILEFEMTSFFQRVKDFFSKIKEKMKGWFRDLITFLNTTFGRILVIGSLVGLGSYVLLRIGSAFLMKAGEINKFHNLYKLYIAKVEKKSILSKAKENIVTKDKERYKTTYHFDEEKYSREVTSAFNRAVVSAKAFFSIIFDSIKAISKRIRSNREEVIESIREKYKNEEEALEKLSQADNYTKRMMHEIKKHFRVLVSIRTKTDVMKISEREDKPFLLFRNLFNNTKKEYADVDLRRIYGSDVSIFDEIFPTLAREMKRH